MKLRIEFTESRSPNFQNVVRLCKTFESYQETIDGNLKIYSVEFDHNHLDLFSVVFEKVRNWKETLFSIDGEYAPRTRILDILYPCGIPEYEKQREKSKRWLSAGVSISINTDKLIQFLEDTATMPREAKKAIIAVKSKDFFKVMDDEGNPIG